MPSERDPELEEVLVGLDIEIGNADGTDQWWDRIESQYAPYALAFYYEIRYLDSMRLRGGINCCGVATDE